MPTKIHNKVYDYIIIGAGSSGCVLANRLSADPTRQVLLLEAGGTDSSPWLHVPIGYFKTMHNPKFDWCYKTEADSGLNHRSIEWPRGKVLGGSSSINGLLYVRGQAEDYDHWAELGNQGWAYKDVLPYFKKSEDNERGANEYHGVGGELSVANSRAKTQLSDLFIEAAEQIGIPRVDDVNAQSQEGASYFQLNITKQGFRCSAATAFLKPALKRKNLTVITRALVQEISIENGIANAVSYSVNGQSQVARLAQSRDQASEILLSAGALGSPHLLMLSGIGEAQELTEHGIDSVKDLPGVGKNLQDHLQIRTVYKVKQPITLNDRLKKPLSKLWMGLEYLFNHRGPLTMAASQVAIFTKTDDKLERPDIQYHFQPMSADKPADGTHCFSAFTASVCQLRPTSRGYLRLKSASARDHIAIHPNYLASKEDQQTAIDAIKLTRKMMQAPALKQLIESEYEPGIEHQSDEDLLNYARQRSTTIYHPSGTCKMGTDAMAVVDDQLKVHGIQCLRVVDCSIMPTLISGNTNAAAIMIAEKAADMINGTSSND